MSGSANIHFASNTFCWFPPDRVPTFCSTEGHFVFSFCLYSSATWYSLSLSITILLEMESRLAKVVLILIGLESTSPFPLRSSVTYAIFALMASLMVFRLVSFPSRSSVPWMSLPYDLPKILMASSVRPAPISPEIPTTSPRLTYMLTPSTTFRPSYWGWYTVQSFTSIFTSPIFTSGRFGKRSVISRPTIPLMILSSGIFLSGLSIVSIVEPSRMTVILSAT